MYKYIFLFNNINGDFMLEKIMCRNIVVGRVNDDLYNVCKVMKENDIGFLPIVDKDKVVGVITDRDIVVNFISNNDDTSFISNYMNRDIISVDINDSVDDVLDLMGTNRVKRVLVTSDGKVVGVISISDLLDCSGDVLDTIKKIFKVGPNKHFYETEIDEFYLWKKLDYSS